MTTKVRVPEEFEQKLKVLAACNDAVTVRVQNAAIKRYRNGLPTLNQQDHKECLTHAIAHINNVLSDDIGDEDSISEQLIHAACRTLLAVFAWQQAHNITVDDLFDLNNHNRP